LILTQPAGYFVINNQKEIYEQCKANDTLFIVDCCGSISNLSQSDGKYADIMVCSFGKDKGVNLGFGGCISTNTKEYFEKNDDLFDTTLFCEEMLPKLQTKLEELPSRLQFLYKKSESIKKDLNKFPIIHKEHKGINVIIKGKDEKVIEYCKKNNLPYTICPRHIRIMDDAISIEVKRLEQKDI
jgi:hypothetical protein